MAEITKFRYPGAKNFTTEQAHLFMGRDDDKEKLYQMIDTRQIVVLYGKSGMGKSSLINAGIIPLLENELNQKPKYFSVRLFNKGQEKDASFVPPLQTLIETVSNKATEKEWLKPLKADAFSKGELWYWLKQWQIAYPRVPIILFFDQFEELFSYSDTEIEEFGEELRTLIYQNIPDYISKGKSLTALEQTAFAQQNEKDREEKEKQIDAIYEKIEIKFVFSIRSDRMALLNKLTKYIPNILKHFYELDALTEEAAKEAIRIPAQIEGDFQTPAFQYQDNVVDAIIERVKNKHDGKIETATLQIICRFIELQKVSQANSIITLNDLGNIKDIFKDFYQSTLNQLSIDDKAKVSKSIEERFIQNNQRIPFADTYLKAEDKWTDNLLKQLEKSTLLRKERDTAGRFIYEIGHDTLIEPILEFAKERELLNKRKRFINLLFIGLIVVIGLLRVIFYMFSLNNRATALYWASEADKLNPIQEIALLEEALHKTNDVTALKVIIEAFESSFNQSNTHQWYEKRYFENIRYAYFSPDSKWLVTRDGNNIAKIWSVEKRIQAEFLKEEKNIRYAYFSPDSKWLVTSDLNNNAKVWSLEKRTLYDFLKEEKMIGDAYFSPDSKWLITRDEYNIPKVWSVDKGILYNFLKEELMIRYAYFSPDSKWIVRIDEHNIAKVWSVDKRIQAEFLKEEKNISSVYFSSDSKWLVTRDEHNITKVWSVDKGIQAEYLKEEKNIRYADFSPDSKWLVTRDEHNIVKVWSVEKRIQAEFLKEEKNISRVYFSSNSKWFVTTDVNRTAKVWSVEQGILYNFLKEGKNISRVYFSPDSKWLVTTDIYNRTVKVWSVEKGIPYGFLKVEENIRDVIFSSDSKWFVTTDVNRTAKVWSVEQGILYDFLKEEKNILKATFSPDSKWLLTIDMNNNITKVWSLEKRTLYDLLKEEKMIRDADFSPSSKLLLTKHEIHIAKVQSMKKGVQAEYLKEEATISDAVLSPDNKWLLTKDENNNYKVWSVATGECYDFLKDEKTIRYATFSPDSKWLITRDVNDNYEVWSVASGKQADFLKEEKKISDATFSEDSKWLITRDENRNAKVWSVAGGKYYDFLKDEKNITEATFSPDSKWLFIRYYGKHKVKTYEVATGKLIQTLWLNKVPRQVDIIDNRYLYVTVGKAIVKTDLQTQQGNLMSYGDGEELDYQYEEIQEWIKVFGDKYLLPLDEEIKKKYGVD